MKRTKETEFISDRLKFILKEMAAKFRQGYVGFASSTEMRREVNNLMGLINEFTYKTNSRTYKIRQIDQNNL